MEKHRPLPLRREFWRTLPDFIRAGIVLCPKSRPENEDICNAAQSILIDHIERRLMHTFERPRLPDTEFYAAFSSAYNERILATEFRIWDEIGNEVDEALRECPARELTEKEAAFMTIAFLGMEEPPQSNELYMNLATFARSYEELLRSRYRADYPSPLYYEALRKHMPKFLFRFIAMDSVMSSLLTLNARPGRMTKENGAFLDHDTVLESRLFTLGEDDSFGFLPKYVEVVRKHAWDKDIREDGLGRTEDRGCPVLYTVEREKIVTFAVNELIEQHRIRFPA